MAATNNLGGTLVSNASAIVHTINDKRQCFEVIKKKHDKNQYYNKFLDRGRNGMKIQETLCVLLNNFSGP
jgi:hypothetical protein